MRLRVTLRARVAATIALAVLGSTVVVTVVAYELERNGTEARFVTAARAGAIADLQQAGGAIEARPSVPPSVVVAEFVAQRGGVSWVVTDNGAAENDSAVGVSADDVPATIWEVIDSGGETDAWTSVNGVRMFAIGGRVGQSTAALVEFYDFGPVDRQLSRLRGDLTRLDIAVMSVAVIVGVGVATRISRPVRLTAAAAQQLGNGALDTRVPAHGRDELGDLATSFNEMAERLSDAMYALQASQAQQRRFVADVSHELRTPLAAMLAAAEGLQSTDTEVRQRSGTLVGEQARRMRSLVEDLLEISRFDAGQARLDVERIDLAALTRDVVRTVAPDQDVRVSTFGDPWIHGDARRLHTILRNLIGNAVQHGAPPVLVTIDGRTPELRVCVSDSGPGIDPRLVPTVFDRFVRADTSRATDSGSTGLGLAIARENAHLHGGTLEVAPGGPTTFVLTLHRLPPAPATPSGLGSPGG